MTVVLDTHAWIWWVSDPGQLSGRARETIEGADRIGVCTISCFELATLVRKGRIELDRGVSAWMHRALSADRVETLDLTAGAAVVAGSLGQDFPGDPADRIIYATAREVRAALVTRDERVRSYDPALTIW